MRGGVGKGGGIEERLGSRQPQSLLIQKSDMGEMILCIWIIWLICLTVITLNDKP